jgi:predicted phosphodiesterase
MGSDVPVRQDGKASTELRVAAAGDIHAHPPTREQVCGHFRSLSDVDLVLLAGDLTTTGEVEQGRVVADACRELEVPAVDVLGNHD